MTAFLTDARHVLRALWRRKALFAAVVMPLALALAVNNALFSVADGLLLRPLPFQDPERLVALEFRRVNGQLPAFAYDPSMVSEREALIARIETSGLIDEATIARPSTAFGARTDEVGLEVVAVDSRFFPLLGLSPLVGTTFTPEDETNSALLSATSADPLPIVIGHGVWTRLFGGDPEVLGVRDLAGRRVRIVGVMAPGVKFPGETNVWTPMRQNRHLLPAYVRLTGGATTEQLASIAPEVAAMSLSDAMRPERSRDLLVLLAGAALLLLVAWVQVGSLVLAGAVGRVHDIGVRLALGAGRLRLVAGFAMENAGLAAVAFAFAWLATRPLTAALVGMLPSGIVRGQYLTPDQRTVWFGAATTLIGFVLLTTLPGIVIRRASPLRLLHGHVGELPFSAERFRRTLLTAQVALTATLLYLSGLMLHSYAMAATFDYGFDSRRVLLFTPPFPRTGGDFEARSREHDRRKTEVVEALGRTPGVIAAAHFFQMPLVEHGNLNSWEDTLSFDGSEVLPRVRVHVNSVSRGFVRALGATLIDGSGLDVSQHHGASDIAVVNETFVKQFAPTFNAMGSAIQSSVVGRQLRTTWFRGRIVGVIRDLVYARPAEPAVPQVFALDARGGAGRLIAIRTSGSIDDVLPAIRTTVGRMWEEVPANNFSVLQDAWRLSLKPYRSPAELLTLITVCSLPLASMGMAGFLLYSVRLRSREIAIRIALGASPSAVRRSVVRNALLIVGVGLIAGAGLGVAAGRMIGHQLFMVRPVDAWTIAGVTVTLLAIAWLAALVPARKAAEVQPVTGLRQV
jgi:predicted permease